MQELEKLPPKTTWLLARNKVTGVFLTDDNSSVYCGKPDKQRKAIQAAIDDLIQHGKKTPDGSKPTTMAVWNQTNRRYEYPEYDGPLLSDVELLDYIPVLRVSLRFSSIHSGNHGSAIVFEDSNSYKMLLRYSFTDEFFKLVGAGKIKMDGDGFYTFDITFVKAGTKVFMELYGYD